MEWKIDKRSPSCFKCQKVFEPQEDLYSAVYDEKEGLKRKDFCAPCWEEGVPAPFSFWKAKGREEERKASVNLRSLRDVLLRLSGKRGGEKGRIAYLLALVLLRKKILSIEEKTQESWLLSFRGEEEGNVRVFPEVINTGEYQDLKEKLERLFFLDEDLLTDLLERD